MDEINYIVFEDDDDNGFTAQWIGIDISTTGQTEQEAVENFQAALEQHFGGEHFTNDEWNERIHEAEEKDTWSHHEIEIERTFLLNSLPDDIGTCDKQELTDTYIEWSEWFEKIRLRKSWETHVITKKRQIDPADASIHEELTIPLSAGEYTSLLWAKGKVITKTRYLYPYENVTIEIDVFHWRLEGFMYAEVEFENKEAMKAFQAPEFLGKDITQEDFVASDYLKNVSFEEVQKAINTK